jgi:hypothetical protein
MNSINKRIAAGLVLAAGMLVGGVASATPITMDFDGLTTGTSVAHYYDGGYTTFLAGFPVDGPGPDYGVTWAGATVAADHASLFLTANALMNVTGGFTSGLSFDFYAYVPGVNSVSIYSGLDGQGTLLAQSDLWSLTWSSLDLSFLGTAKSVVFHGLPAFFTGFDNVTLQDTPHAVPEPAALGMFGLGVLLIGMFAGMRKRARQN